MPAESVQIAIRIPASVADDDVEERARVLLVLDAVRSGRISWRAAAQALDIAPDALLELARVHGLQVQRFEPGDMEQDLATLTELERRRAAGG